MYIINLHTFCIYYYYYYNPPHSTAMPLLFILTLSKLILTQKNK